MTITSIEKSGKHGRAAVCCDDELFGLIEWDTVRKMGLHVGDDVDENELAEAVGACERKYAKDKALSIVARREVCRKMLLDKLNGEFSEEAAEYAADLLEENGLLSDERFARLYAEKLFLDKGFYTRRVAYELRSRGIDRELAEETAMRLAPEDEYEALTELLASRRFGNTDFSDERAVRRLTGALMRSGYDADVIRRAVREHTEYYDE